MPCPFRPPRVVGRMARFSRELNFEDKSFPSTPNFDGVAAGLLGSLGLLVFLEVFFAVIVKSRNRKGSDVS